MSDALIWRDSVFKNDFICICCGTSFNNRTPIRLEDLMLCPTCHFVVGKVVTVAETADQNLTIYERRSK